MSFVLKKGNTNLLTAYIIAYFCVFCKYPLPGGFGNKYSNEEPDGSKREAGARDKLNEFFRAKNWSNQANWRNKSLAAAQ
jgi:hypothetical protein